MCRLLGTRNKIGSTSLLRMRSQSELFICMYVCVYVGGGTIPLSTVSHETQSQDYLLMNHDCVRVCS